MEVRGFTLIGEHKDERGQVAVTRYFVVKLNLILRIIHQANTVLKRRSMVGSDDCAAAQSNTQWLRKMSAYNLLETDLCSLSGIWLDEPEGPHLCFCMI